MPVIKQAIKKVRQDKRKTAVNLLRKNAYKKAIHDFRKTPTAALLTTVYKALDKAAKVNVIHKNKASRLKSRLSKLVKSTKVSSKPKIA
ncbi:MAG TPA: 30S ribosomal protein S20 [Candidatus Saccharimonadales bacterium]|nr:30S ribosomal protein S20 [Candidatus Saccharimonadales bacterium]